MPFQPDRFQPSGASAAIASALLAGSALLAAGPACAADAPVVVPMQSVTRLTPSGRDDDEQTAVASAEEMQGSPSTELVLRGNAEIRRAGGSIRGDKLVYSQRDDEVRAEGNASVFKDGATFRSPKIVYRLTERTGESGAVDFEYAPVKLRGTAACARFQPDSKTELDGAMITTCPKDDKSWWIEMDKLTLDQYEQEGVGRGAVLKLGGVPVLGAPWFTFPITAGRKSGFLAPSFGTSSTRGVDVTLPYYFNIAPNYDYTLTPRVMTKRGLLLGNNARWLNKYFYADVDAQIMPEDKQTKHRRYGVQANLGGSWNGFWYGINYNQVSDSDYTRDFSTNVRGSLKEILPQDYWIGYGRDWWHATLSINKNQTLNIGGQKYDKPYERAPRLMWSAYVGDLAGFEVSTMLDATRFVHPEKPDGNRFVIDQSIAYPLRGAGWFVTPKARVTGAWYELKDPWGSAGTKSPSRVTPQLSVDSGLIFDRETNLFGRAFSQTLEPRLMYAYIPYSKQSDIPVFDSSAGDMSFAQLLDPNQWTGYDRVNETSQVTALLTTRFFESDTGIQRFNASVGARYNFNDRTINYSGERVKLEHQKSDVLASVGARLTRALSADVMVQHSFAQHKSKRLTAGVRWQPKPMSVMSLYFRQILADQADINDRIRQIDFSMQWPLTSKLYVLMRHDYSLVSRKFLETLLGVEYHHDCWILRAVAQRYVTSRNKTETNYYLQLELAGLAGIGTSPLSHLRESIRGYQQPNPFDFRNAQHYDYYR
ncbi:MAG: LPS-assembly protein LptD [Duodenibacillus sp.]|nr:LPS-assembly protein LptD [Duodenibacillus sp.]